MLLRAFERRRSFNKCGCERIEYDGINRHSGGFELNSVMLPLYIEYGTIKNSEMIESPLSLSQACAECMATRIRAWLYNPCIDTWSHKDSGFCLFQSYLFMTDSNQKKEREGKSYIDCLGLYCCTDDYQHYQIKTTKKNLKAEQEKRDKEREERDRQFDQMQKQMAKMQEQLDVMQKKLEMKV
jgi:hypothetical protein